MTYIAADHWASGQEQDGTWVVKAREIECNEHSALLPVGRYGAPPLRVGKLVRMETDKAGRSEYLWRVVAQVEAISGSIAVLVPSDISADVPAASVVRVEMAAKGTGDHLPPPQNPA